MCVSTYLPFIDISRNPDTGGRKMLGPQEQATINYSIVAANRCLLRKPILVGVGDEPWDEMQQFDDNITERLFDSFQVWRDLVEITW
ncbi:hypothetical protein HN51_064584, partial [Arachis hypogaea]